jgi:GAF domain-containing protein
VLADPEYTWSEAQKIGGYRSALGVPLLHQDNVVGVIFIGKTVPQPFTAKQIELATTFGDQAVIAMENARLLGELRERTDDLQQSLEYQTATSDVLKVISRSDADLETVLENLVETMTRLCQADYGHLFRRRDSFHHLIASFGISAEYRDYLKAHPFVPDRGTLSGRVSPFELSRCQEGTGVLWPPSREYGCRSLQFSGASKMQP